MSVRCFPPSLYQHFSRGPMLPVLYALIFLFLNSLPTYGFAQWLIKQMDFSFPPLCTEITIFLEFGIFLSGKQT